MLYLKPMDPGEYAPFLDYAITNYAEEKVRAGNYSPDDALRLSTEEYATLLPAGLDTLNSYLFMLVKTENKQKAGFIWLLLEQTGSLRYATVVNVLIYEQFRRQGYGRLAFALIEEYVRSLGLQKITLHVFGHNQAARSLYEQIGYTVTNVHMSKDLTPLS